MKHIASSVPVKRITPGDGHYFFGYYDLQPYNASETLHLTHRTDFRNRMPTRDDTVDLGVIDVKTGRYEKIGVSGAWNFQQGAMLQWNPLAADREVIYNDLVDGEHHGVIQDIHTGKKRFLDRPVANVSLDGKYAVSINMSRLFDFRPGYGYPYPGDSFFYEKHSDADGVFLIDMETGKSKLVLSLQEIWDFTGKHFARDEKMIINHITFNPSASRFLALVRNFPAEGKKHETAVITADRDGKNMFLLSDYGVQSHYYWVNDEQVIIFGSGAETACSKGWADNYLLTDRSHEGTLVGGGYWGNRDNHMRVAPDGRYMITDCYPDKNRMQVIQLLDLETDHLADLGLFYSMPNVITDVRCDLHPRWNRSNTGITFDSTHEGFRGIYKMDLPTAERERIFTDMSGAAAWDLHIGE